MEQNEVERLTLEDFKSHRLPAELAKALDTFNGGSFMECHTAIFEATGIWIEELVPVFQRLDAMLVTRDRRPAGVR
jgi:hypothetical protein